MIRLKVPATTANLGSGFDTLGMALSLYNIFTVKELLPEGEYTCEIWGEGVDLLHELRDGSDRVLGAQGGQVHHGEALLEDVVRNDLLQAGGNQFQMTGNRLLVRGIAILGKQFHSVIL